MSKSNTFENDLLKLIFWGDAIADIAENDTSSPLTDLYVALHTADPGEGGTASTNECAYTGYAREAVSRDSSGFSISGNAASLFADVVFGTKTAGTDEVVTHFSITVASSGASKILYSGTVTPNITVVNGVPPSLTTGTTVSED